MPSQALLNAQRVLAQYRERDGVDVQQVMPSHAQGCDAGAVIAMPDLQRELAPDAVDGQVVGARSDVQILHHGEVAVAAMREGMSSHYQLWLAARMLDEAGCGWVRWEDLCTAVCQPGSWFMYQVPRLRQILREGEGLFWDVGKGRVWLRSLARVAGVFGLQRLGGEFVTIDRETAVAGAQRFRAVCFAAWLTNHKNPMTQATIERLTGIGPRTQRRYCRIAGIEKVENVAVGPRWCEEAEQEAQWQQGGVFRFTDWGGQQGPSRAQYVAWRLPTSYRTSEAGKKRRQKGRLKGLGLSEFPGNDQGTLRRIFFADARTAVNGASRQGPGDRVYWMWRKARTGRGLWHGMGG